MKKDLRRLALRLRNWLSPTNSLHVDRKASFKSQANILRTRIEIRGSSQVVLKDGVRLRNAELLVRGDANCLVIGVGSSFSGRIELFGDGNTVIIGGNSSITGSLLVAHNGRAIHIGDGCLFAQQTELRTTDSHKVYDADGRRINMDADICIQDRVWLAMGVVVLKGVTIDAGSVVGARSVVTKSLPGSSIAAGMPARVIKSGISWTN